jgi:hypothetical protein
MAPIVAEQKREGGVSLSEEDRARMARLYEGVTGRVEEMALIVARTLGKPSQGHTEVVYRRRKISFDIKRGQGSEREAMATEETEVIHFEGCGWGCYDHGQGICYPC